MSPLLDFRSITSSLACPRCQDALVCDENLLSCRNANCLFAQPRRFPIVGSHPVLVDFENSILSEDEVLATGAASLVTRRNAGRLKSFLLRSVFPISAVTVKNIDRFIALAKEVNPNPTVLVVGGGMIGSGNDALYADPAVRLVAFDIYASPLTQFVADGHSIPLSNQCVDAVLVQAVLEHVLDPWRVVAEIHRVLRPGGVVYAETPFLQQVHEGAYDFTRFTESGHRYLFRSFALVDSGVVQGPGTQLRWTIGHIGRSIFRSKSAAKIFITLFFWVSYLDYICAPREAIDGACGVFFLGKRADAEVTPRQMVAHYKGAQVG
jgi:SAM-dependent methyltransferase